MYLPKYLTYARHNRWNPNRLGFVIFFVTSKCNYNCKTCFYWDRLNKPGDLTYDEIVRLSRSAGRFHTLLFSGGEPFLRPELPQICELFWRQNGVRIMAIPTNASMPDHVRRQTEAILQATRLQTLSINLSIDGRAAVNDAIRSRREGGFSKTLETLRQVCDLRSRYPALEVAVNTVVCDLNAEEIEALMDDLWRQCRLERHHIELLRGSPNEPTLHLPPAAMIRRIHRQALRNRERYIARGRAAGLGGRLGAFLESVAVLGTQAYAQVIKERFVAGRRWPFTCTAGRAIVVIDANGDVRVCEILTEPIGNLREADYDLPQILRGPTNRRLTRWIADTRCSCTHGCFINLSMASYPSTLLKAPWHYLRYRWGERRRPPPCPPR